MSRESVGQCVRTASTRTRSKPPPALTGRYSKRSSINFAQGLIARLSITEVNTILTPSYTEPPPTAVPQSRRPEEFYDCYETAVRELWPLTEDDTSSLPTRRMDDLICSCPDLHVQNTSRATSPDSSQVSSYDTRADWNKFFSSTNSVTSTQNTCPTPVEQHPTSTGVVPVRALPQPLQTATRSASAPLQKKGSDGEEKSTGRSRLSRLLSFKRKEGQSKRTSFIF